MTNSVFVLLVIGYNAIGSQVVETRELSWHTSFSDCRSILIAEEERGRGVFYNENLVCVQVEDPAMATAARNAGRNDYPLRYGSRYLQ